MAAITGNSLSLDRVSKQRDFFCPARPRVTISRAESLACTAPGSRR